MNKAAQILKKYTNTSLMLRIFIGLVIGAVLGLLVPSWTGIGILGRMFVSALKGIAPVLVAVLVTSSVAKAGKGHGHRFAALIAVYRQNRLKHRMPASSRRLSLPFRRRSRRLSVPTLRLQRNMLLRFRIS